MDLTDPDDVKALLGGDGPDVLVHFGDRDFLERYQRYEQNLTDWKTKYPKLASVDMRYERSVVLEMSPGASVPVAGADAAEPGATAAKTPISRVSTKTPVKAKPPGVVSARTMARPPATEAPVKHLTQAFDVHAKPRTANGTRGPQ